MDYDAIVIGAGLGGCAAGAALAGAGQKVVVLEKLPITGGRSSTVEKKGFMMDLGPHGCLRSEYGPQEEVLRRVGLSGEIEYERLRNCMFRVEGKGGTVDLFKWTALIREMLPPELLKMVGTILPSMMPILTSTSKQYDDVSIQDFLNRVTDNVVVHSAIDLFQMSFMGTPYWDTSFGELFRVAFDELGPMLSSIADHGTPCIGYPKGGLIKYTSMMCEGISNHGGEIRTNVEIENIILEKGKAVGVRTRDGEEIRAKAIISNAGIKETVLDLVGKDHFEKEYVEYIESLVPGTTGMVVRLALDEPVSDLHAIISFPNKDIQTYFRKVYEEHELPDEIPPNLVTFPSNLDETLVPEGRQNALIILLLGQDTEVDEQKMHDLGLASMEEVIPGISKHIIWSDYLGPKFWRSMGEEGAGIGLAQSIGQVGEKRPSILSPIEDLYYVGMETGRGMSGICGEFAVDSGLACADYIVKNAPVTI